MSSCSMETSTVFMTGDHGRSRDCPSNQIPCFLERQHIVCSFAKAPLNFTTFACIKLLKKLAKIVLDPHSICSRLEFHSAQPFYSFANDTCFCPEFSDRSVCSGLTWFDMAFWKYPVLRVLSGPN